MGNPAEFTVTAESRLPSTFPRLERDYDQANHRYRDDYLDPTYELQLDADPGSETIDTFVVEGPRGKPKRVEITKLNVPDDAVSYDWRIKRRDGTFRKEVSTPIRRSTVGGQRVATGRPYELDVEVPGPGVYDVHLRVRRRAGGGFAHAETFDLRDYLVVSIGDSYASGEGNPDRPGEPEGFELDADWWEVLVLPWFAYKLSKAALDWGWNTLKREASTLSQALGLEIAMDPRPVWLEERAHRSLLSGPAIATRLLEDVGEGELITFVSFARSGAEIREGLFGPRSDGDAWIGGVGQLDELRDLQERVGDRPIDALVVSIGGNDVGFSGRLTDLVEEDSTFLSLTRPGKDADRAAVRRKVEADLEALRADLDALAREIDRLDVRRVYLTEYPTAHFDRTRNGRTTVEEGCGIFSSRFDADVDRGDAQLMRSSAERLNGVLREAADAHGWVYVGGVADGFDGRGYCAGEDSYFVSAEGSLVLQGDTDGTLHPNARGQRVYAERIAAALDEHMLDGADAPENRPRDREVVRARRGTRSTDASDPRSGGTDGRPSPRPDADPRDHRTRRDHRSRRDHRTRDHRTSRDRPRRRDHRTGGDSQRRRGSGSSAPRRRDHRS